jgi:hypothetical protein
MPSAETSPFQVDLFTGALVDTRSQRQKDLDRARTLPQDQFLFSQSEIAPIGVNPHPKLKWDGRAPLELLAEALPDTRTEEEIEAEREAAERKLIAPMFPDALPIAEVVDVANADTDEEQLTSSDADDDAGETLTLSPQESSRPQYALADLEAAIADIQQTIMAAPEVLLAQAIWLAQATSSAHLAGIAPEVITDKLKQLDGLTRPKPYPAHIAHSPHAGGSATGILFDSGTRFTLSHLPAEPF